MKTATRTADRSTIVLDVEVDARELQAAIDEAVRHLSRRTRVPGFRPGKVPRPMLERALGVRRGDPGVPDPVYDEAREHLYERTVLSAVREMEADVLEVPGRPDWTTFVEGEGAAYSVRLPVRPEVVLGDYTGYPFRPAVEPVTDERIAAVIEQLRDQHAALVPVEGRSAAEEDFAVIAFAGRHDGVDIEGARSDRFPLVIGRERMVPGFEANLVGMAEGESRMFSVTFPDDYDEQELAGEPVEFSVNLLELRERRLPPLDDDLASLVGPYPDLAALREELRVRLRGSSLDRARHAFADRVIEYAVANATVEPPDVMVEREVDVMLDELRVRLAEQGIGYEDYLRVTERDEAAVHAEHHEQAAHRVKVLMVLGAIADREKVEAPDAAVEAEVTRVREGEGAGSRLAGYLASDRGRAYIRSRLRRSLTVELLVDRWIADHPDFADMRHLHERIAAADEGADPDGTEQVAVAVALAEPAEEED